MKYTNKILLMALAAAGVGMTSAHALTFGFSSVANATVGVTEAIPASGVFNRINFNNGTAGDVNGSFADFEITLSDGAGDAVGLYGDISGNFDIDPTTVVDTGGGNQLATVNGTGTLTIDDGVGNLFQGNIVFTKLGTFGIGGVLNFTGSVNLTGITYAGANVDLLEMADPESAITTVTFQFATFPGDIDDILASGGSTSYSGSITSIPDGGWTVTLLGGALLGLAFYRRRAA